MAPKTKTNTAHNQLQTDIKDEAVLQAVLLADPFGVEQSWGPLAMQDDDEGDAEGLPWCLLPLFGTPLLLWTLDSLALGGVQQVFMFVRDGIGLVRSRLSKSTFLHPDSPMSITIIQTTAFSAGDVLREVDSRALLKTKTDSGSDVGTFVLAQCGYIGNLDLLGAAQRFAARRKADGGLPCLSAVMESRPDRRCSTCSATVHLLDRHSRLYYLHTDQHKFPADKLIDIPTELFQQPQDLLMRADLEPVGLDLCSVEVPQLFTENFDYQTVRPDFIHGILTSDLLGKTILCEVVKESHNLGPGVSWATLVGDVKSYDRTSKDILARRSQPFVLDQARLGGPPPFSQRRGMVYMGEDVDLAPDCKIGNSTCLGHGCTISRAAEVRQAYIGRSSQVGPSSQVTNSYIFDGVTIGPNATIKHSIIGSNVCIKADCVMDEGCLVGPGVVVGEGTELRGVNVSLEGPAGSCELEGPGSKGVVWARVEDAGSQSGGQRSNASGDSDSEDEKMDPRNTKFARLGATYPRAGINSPASSSTSLSSLSSNGSSSGTTQIQNIGSIGEVGATKDFLVECIRSLERAFREDHTVENASIELKTLRMASNVPQSEFRSVVLAQVCELVHRDPSRLKKWGPLIKTVSGREEDLDDMEEVLLDLQGWCAEKIGTEDQVKFYSQMLQYFYNEDIVSEEGIIKWFKSGLSRRTGGSEGLKLREIGGKFLQMLMEADDDEDEESDED